MAKSPDAFRTISEVADWLGIQAHVLRFWESKFTQVKPIKRAGGRRYYRPNDMLLLGGIKQLLHEDGFTIKGVQKILREEGMSHVASLSPPLDELTLSQIKETDPAPKPVPPASGADTVEAERGVVLSFEPGTREDRKETPPEATDTIDNSPNMDATAASSAERETPAPEDPPLPVDQVEPTPPEPPRHVPEVSAGPSAAQPAELDPQPRDPAVLATPDEHGAPGRPADDAPHSDPQEAAPVASAEHTDDDGQSPDSPAQVAAPPDPAADQHAVPDDPTARPAAEDAVSDEAPATLPSFLRRPAEPDPKTDQQAPAAVAPTPAPVADAASEPAPEAAVAPQPAPKPGRIDIPAFVPESDIEAFPAVLNAVYRARSLTPARATQIAPLLKRLVAVRDSMAEGRVAVQQPLPKD